MNKLNIVGLLLLVATGYGQQTSTQKRRPPLLDLGCGKCDGDDRFEIVNEAGLCLDADVDRMKNNGGRVQVWGCSQKPEQQWRLRGNSIMNVGGGTCLEVVASAMYKNGGQVQVWHCEDTRPQQRWGREGDSLLNYGGMCLDADDRERRKNGGRVQVWSCVSGAGPQVWRFNLLVER